MAECVRSTRNSFEKLLVRSEDKLHTIREKIANGGIGFNQSQCLYLSSEVSKTVQIAREFMSRCGGSDDGPVRHTPIFLLQCPEEVDVFVGRCRIEDWITEVIFRSEYALLGTPQDLRQSSIFLPTPLSDVLRDKVELRKRLEGRDELVDVKSMDSALARYFLARMKSEESESNTSETCGEILWQKETQPSETSVRLGSGARASAFKINWLGAVCAKKVLHLQESELDILKEASILESNGSSELLVPSPGYDVFITHQGTDLNNTFMAHRNAALKRVRLFQEAKSIAQARHPNVVNLFGYGNEQERGGISILMELMDEDLSTLINRRMGIPKDFSISLEVMRQIAHALYGMHYMHNEPILHRDLKAANILVNEFDFRTRDYTVNTVDFGTSKSVNLDVDALQLLGKNKNPKNDAYHEMSDVLYSSCKPGKGERRSVLRKVLSSKMRSFRAVGTGPARNLNGRAPDIPDDNGAHAKDLVGPADAVVGFKKSKSLQMCSSEDADMSSGRVGVHGAHREFGNEIFYMQKMELEGSQMIRSILNHDGPSRKRIPARQWSAEENRAMLEMTQEVVDMDVGPCIWDYVSENLFKQYGFDRASNSCRDQWDSQTKCFNAIREHEGKIKSGTSNCVSYWEMDEDERSKNKLLQAFNLEWYEMMEKIQTAKSLDERTGSIHMEADLPSYDLPLSQSQLDAGTLDSADHDEILFDELMDSEIEDIGTESEDEEVSGDSTTTFVSQAGVPVRGHVPQTKQTFESEYETNSKYAGRKRSAARVMEDDLISIISPFVNKQIEDALKPLLSALRSREEDEQKHREKLLAMVEEKLAPKREKMQFTDCVLADSNFLATSNQGF